MVSIYRTDSPRAARRKTSLIFMDLRFNCYDGGSLNERQVNVGTELQLRASQTHKLDQLSIPLRL